MISILPQGFNDFHCKAGACRHTCCQKWEIDIDDDTADYYRGLKTPLGKKIQDHMEKGPDGWHFKLTDKGFCALLRTDGLCEVITALGEDKLCDICTVHPRFFTYVDEFILCGTGLCCEASCELLLAPHEPLTFTEEDTAFIYTFKELLDFIGFSLPESLTHYAPLFSSKSCQSILADLMITEPIDEAWTEEIRSLQGMIPALLEKVASYEKTYDPISFDRIYQFIFYRQLDKVEAYGLDAVRAYARRSTDFIFMETALHGNLEEALRRWSEQIEYDTDNVDWLLERL